MSTIEKLIVQIFDQKRQIIQQLNHHKQLYHQHLISKLLIHGITPPPYLLSSDVHSCFSSDLTELNKEELISGLLLPRAGPLSSYPSGPCFQYDNPVREPANSSEPDLTCGVKSSSSNGINEDEPVVAPSALDCGSEEMADVTLLSHIDGGSDMPGIVPPPLIDGYVEKSNYAPMSPQDQTDTSFTNAYKLEESLGRIQRSRSRQKALELRKSAKENGKSRLGMEDEAGMSSRAIMDIDKQLDGLQESVVLDEPLVLPSENCVNEVVVIGNDCGDSWKQPGCSKGNEVRLGDSEMKRNNSVYSGPLTRSRSSRRQPNDIVSCSKKCSSDEHFDILSGSLKSEDPSRLPLGNCSKEQAIIEKFSDKERTIDAIGACLTYSSVLKGKELETGSSQKGEKCSSKQCVSETLPLYPKSNEVFVGPMTRSKGSKTQQGINNDLRNTKRNYPDHVLGKSKTEGDKITNFKSHEVKEVDTGNGRLRSRKDASVKPKQLDFDEVEESNLGAANCLSGTISQSEGNTLCDFSVSYVMDGSWPCQKRRKMVPQNLNKSASPTLRVNSFCAVNENVANESSEGEEENIPSMPQNLSNSFPIDAPVLSCAKEVDQSIHFSLIKEHAPTALVQYGKDEDSIGLIMMGSTCEPQHVSEPDVSTVNETIIVEPSESLSEDREGTIHEPSGVIDNEEVSDALLTDQDLVNVRTSLKSMDISVDQNRSSLRVDESKFSIISPLMEHMDVSEASQSIPEFEAFVIGENTNGLINPTVELDKKDVSFFSNMIDRTSTPLSPFPSACKVYLAPGIYSSVPKGVLENIDPQSNMIMSGNALLGKSHSDIFPFPGSQCGWDMKKHFLSPVGNVFEGITSKSGDSDIVRSNTELTCFPIMEDPESSEEMVNDDVNTSLGRTNSTMKNSANIEPQIDTNMEKESTLAPNNATERESSESMTLKHENCLVVDPSVSRCSKGSISTEIGIQTKYSNVKKSGMSQRSRGIKVGKENKGFSVGANSSKKHGKAQSSGFRKPQLSAISNLRSRGQSMSEKEKRPNNIVSNVKSFLPLVQQKQAASVVPEKRDVKVKALQAAEAAKRAAEKRENERKQKKEAMKLERARVEQEQAREMELKKKLKEEERKKREAENAAKKRQREEEERQEKERKRKRIEDARLQHKQAEMKLHAWREESRNALEASNNDIAGNSTPNFDKDKKAIDQVNVEESYDISPYQCSDDEDEDEDEIPNKKFVPTWASKNCVALALSSLQHIDPEEIYPPGSFCSLDEVLLPRRLPQK